MWKFFFGFILKWILIIFFSLNWCDYAPCFFGCYMMSPFAPPSLPFSCRFFWVRITREITDKNRIDLRWSEGGVTHYCVNTEKKKKNKNSLARQSRQHETPLTIFGYLIHKFGICIVAPIYGRRSTLYYTWSCQFPFVWLLLQRFVAFFTCSM